MELESAVSGILQSIHIPPGGEAASGQEIATFAVKGDLQEPETARQGVSLRIILT